MDDSDTDAESTLREQLVGSLPPGRRAAAAALADRAAAGLSLPTVARLAGRVRRDPDPLVRRRAVDALGRAADGTPVENDGAVRPAVGRALDDEDGRVRAAAVLAVARIDPRTTERLLGALGDGDALVRRNAVAALATVGGEARGPLAKRLGADPDYRVRAEAARVLPTVTDSEDATHLLSDALLSETHAIVRTRIVDALGEVGTEHALAVAEREGRNDADAVVRRAAARALDRGPPPRRGLRARQPARSRLTASRTDKRAR